MEAYKYLILGGGTTAGYAAQEFVEQGIGKNELCVVSAESLLPMNRPPFSKQYLVDESADDEILINEKIFYDKNGIDVKLETCAKKVDFGKKKVELDNGENIGYEKLLIATGSSLKHLGVDGGDLKNIFYLRNIKHADKIRKKAEKSKNAVIVGGGYIGSETAASISEKGVKVTMVIPEDQMLAKFTNEDLGKFFKKVYKEHGIDLIFEDEVIAFHGDDKVKEVELASGKKLEADMVVVGIGVEPNISLFEGSSIKIGNGIRINEYCETGVDGVYAAGDVVEFPDFIFNKKRHVEHWENAFEMGKHAALVMTGKREPYIFLPYFFSDFFDYSYEYFGDQSSADFSATRGNIESGDFSHWWFQEKRLVAAFVMSKRPEEEGKKAREWIKTRTPINRDEIGNETKSLDSLELRPEHHSDVPKP
jgi:NADPH-dependent 2,4-dienoyl-CoA reductase/sulfur reductase-like enzyme